VLRRMESDLETVAVEKTNRRGGQPRRQRVRAGAVKAPRERISDITRSLDMAAPVRENGIASRPFAPLGSAPLRNEPLSLQSGEASRAERVPLLTKKKPTAPLPLSLRLAGDILDRLI